MSTPEDYIRSYSIEYLKGYARELSEQVLIAEKGAEEKT